VKTAPESEADKKDPENWVEAPDYQPLRAGQFRFTELVLVDRFGRGYEIVRANDEIHQRATPARAATVIPDDKQVGSNQADALVHISNAAAWNKHLFQLRPRLLQPARLDFEFIAQTSDTVLAPLASTGEQVHAWIVPNYTDQGLLCYAPTGTLLGELRPTPSGITWDRFHPSAPTLGQISRDFPHLSHFLNGISAKTNNKAALADLITTIDTARRTIAVRAIGTGHPTLRMLGRPLALLRARLKFTADADPIVAIKPSQLTKQPPTAEYQDYTWPILLGSTSSFHDGLIGYLDQLNYGTLYAVPELNNPLSDYIATRGNGTHLALSLSGPARLVTLLTDPWAPVHATTHLLPTAALRLDPDAIAHTLAHLEAVFHIGPALGTLRAVVTKNPTPSARAEEVTESKMQAFPLPLPAVEHGDWSWTNPEGTTTVVTATDTTARLTPETPTHLRTGLLRLTHPPPPRDPHDH
jgi:hypothetical protein